MDLGQAADVTGFAQAAIGPTDEAGHAMPSLPDFGFLAAHPRVEIPRPHEAAVVGLKK